MKTFRIKISDLKKGSARIRINKDMKHTTYEDLPPFIKEKMAKGEKMLREVGLPKEIQEAISLRSK